MVQELARITSVSLDGNIPTIGTGYWNIISGIGGAIANPNSPISSFSGIAGNTYKLSWTISNPPCAPSSDTLAITFNEAPSVANAGIDQIGSGTCGITSVSLDGNIPTVGTGYWNIISGIGGAIANPNSPISSFSGIAGNTYKLSWTISNPPCAPSSDTLAITFNEAPSVANAGIDQIGSGTCGITSVSLDGNIPTVGTGYWNIISGIGGAIANPNSPISSFSGIAGNTYKLSWTISNPPCAPSSDTLAITFNEAPSVANAGIDQIGSGTCGITSVSLDGNIPTVGTGYWNIISGIGGAIANPNMAKTNFTGIEGNTYKLSWTISNPPCAPSSDTLAITFNEAPSVANAGIDQIGSGTCGITSVSLDGNIPTVGTGYWNIISGIGGAIANPNSPISSFSGIAGSAYKLSWTISNPPCAPSSDTLAITFNEAPSVANAGIDQIGSGTCGITSVSLDGNIPTIGTGYWNIISGIGGAIANPNSPISSFSGIAGNTYKLSWTISNPPCAPSSDTLAITFNEAPSVANAGIDQIGSGTCGITSVSLDGNIPTVGTGYWNIISGIGGAIANPNSPISSFSGIAGNTYKLSWTISNPPCAPSSDTLAITFNEAPSVANAGIDQIGSGTCGITSVSLDGNIPTVGTGYWNIISGIGGAIANPNMAKTSFTGIAGRNYKLSWTISNPPCAPSSDTLAITFNEAPSVANAGIDQIGSGTCGITSVSLDGNIPTVGTGYWNIISGIGGTIANPNMAKTSFTGIAGRTYKLSWTISNPPCAPSSDTLAITFNEAPSVANAGIDQIGSGTCGITSVSLDGNIPTVGTGYWNIISGIGGTIANPNMAKTNFTGIAGNTYKLSWTISNPPCAPSSDTLAITFNEAPSVANAGIDQIGSGTCGITSVSLDGNIPTVGTGYWNIISGIGGAIANPNLAKTSFTGIAGSSYKLSWTISNPPCAPSSDTLAITFNEAPSVANAGIDQIGSGTCGITNVSLDGNIPTVGTGYWNIISGIGGAIANPNLAKTSFTGIAGSSYKLSWTISNPPCAPSSDTVAITFNEAPSVANAGIDQIGSGTCGITSVSLDGNIPTVGNGYWNVISGIGGTIANPNSPISSFSGIAGNTYQLSWTISNPPCAPSSDTVAIKFNEAPSVANAGIDQIGSGTCGITSVSLDGNIPTVGTGYWNVISGIGGAIANPNLAKTSFTGIAGSSYKLSWTISNPPCAPSSDTLAITFNEAPSVANAGIDQIGSGTCGITSVSLDGNIPTVGTGYWNIISGIGGAIANPNMAKTNFTGIEGNTYKLSWTISNPPCAPSSDTLAITFNEAPSVANAGIDQIGSGTCGITNISLDGNIPTVGTGYWNIISGIGGTIANPNMAKTNFTGIEGNTYKLSWTISNPPCAPSSDTLAITFNEAPSVANAGIDQIGSGTCGITSVSLDGNIPTVGTGYWNIISGIGGTIANPNMAKTSFTGIAGRTYKLSWTISNPPCAPSSDTVAITFNEAPTVIATPDAQTICNEGITNIALSTKVSGEPVIYSWTVTQVSGTCVGQTNGSGSKIQQSLTNWGTSPAVVRYTITPAIGIALGAPTNVDITVNPSPKLAIVSNNGLAICEYDSINLTVSKNNSYKWNTGEITQTITVKRSGIYSVTATNEYGCIATDSVQITVLEATKCEISLNDMAANTGETITVSIKLDKVEHLFDNNKIQPFTADISYYSNVLLLLPEDANIENSDFNNNTKYNTIRINGSAIEGNNELLNLKFLVHLGEKPITDIIIDSVKWTSYPCAVTNNAKAKFTVSNICYENRVRLIKAGASIEIKSINPNPSKDNIIINYSIIEQGATELILVNLLGETVKSIRVNTSSVGMKTELIPLENVPQGVYFLILRTPTAHDSKVIRVIR